ncbi:hypothetical protein [Nocardioides houyundeii]|uniref:hypothetical protein n=1 Tax=Nocardioides houyundeii TaxID=2045452 RepID=UPI0013B43CCC|nr:hypothetical protein [Nocardioides houyundeii]
MALPEFVLRRHLAEQLLFLDSSCESFDNGRLAECKRLATHVRVVVHDGPVPKQKKRRQSKSLLTHLGVKQSIGLHDPVVEVAIRASESEGRFVGAGLANIEVGATSARYVPRYLNSGLGELVSFDEWWESGRMWPDQGPAVSRREIVDWLANKDGGAHIDEDLPPTYVALTDHGAMGCTFSHHPGLPPETPSPIPVAMREIAEELRVSLRLQLPHLLD